MCRRRDTLTPPLHIEEVQEEEEWNDSEEVEDEEEEDIFGMATSSDTSVDREEDIPPIYNCAVISIVALGIGFVITGLGILIITGILSHMEASHQDQVINNRFITLYLNGNNVTKINGSQIRDSSGTTEYSVILPSYNISLPTCRIPECADSVLSFERVFIEIHMGDSKPLIKTKEDLQDCPEMEENVDKKKQWQIWCLKLDSPWPVSQPIFVEYHAIFKPEHLVSFNRTFIVENWNRQ